jgi:hypothetical protein
VTRGATGARGPQRVTPEIVVSETPQLEVRRRPRNLRDDPKATIDPVIRTYMLGSGVWELRTRMESGAAKVALPGQGTTGQGG